ncbi:glycoside hydrolase family 31 protein [Halorhabdus amylolytica]|uniref:glycoside hydrolase family 31 protein n=1 Tax=Halorhabdus amylolytica TaxID=2559573 RepID=UPI0010A9BE1A|nr:TIM-barrel domain-containing protein [Halorhabdus amylolytica]
MSIQTVRTDSDGVTFAVGADSTAAESTATVLRVEPVTDSVFRVVYTGETVSPADGSFIVESLPDDDVDWTVRTGSETCSVSTDEVTLAVDRETAAFTWRDADGTRYVGEPTSGGKHIAEVSPEEKAVGDDVSGPEPSLSRTAYETKVALDFADDEAIYGLGQHEEGIDDYRDHMQHLYQTNTKVAMPAIVSTRGYGILWDTYSLAAFHDDQHGSYFWSECDDQLEFYFVAGPDLDDVVAGFRALTGDPTLFPKWAYGFVQSKERYETQSELLSVVEEYRNREIPLDVIVQDWQYWPSEGETNFAPDNQPDAEWGQWGQKSFDADRFPDPDQLTADLHDLGVKLMISVWPNMHSGRDRKEMEDNGFIMDETDIVPGPENEQGYYDVFDPNARALYWKHADDGLFSHGVDAWWCDSTEPYAADWSLDDELQPFERTRHNANALKTVIDPEYINAYSLLHSKGIYEGQRETTEDKRVVNLTRSGYPGQHRYGAITWSGDVEATWDRLEKQIADGLQFTATGNPRWTLDVGGFFVDSAPQWFIDGNYPDGHEDEGYRELYTRWFQFGTFLPMLRSHGTDTPREVWRFGEPGDRTYDTIVKFDELRYRLLPYIYSLAGWETHREYTMFRHLSFDFREDEAVHDIVDQFMFGPSLMVCPVTEPMYYGPESEPLDGTVQAREVYLPEGTDWFDFWTGRRYDGGQTILADAPLEKVPIFVPAGSILPMGPVKQHTEENPDAPWQIRVYPGADASFDVYEDRGDGYDYEDGEYAWTTLRWDESTDTLVVEERDGDFPKLREERMIEASVVSEGNAVGHEPATDPTTAVYDGSHTERDLDRP